MCLTFCLLVIAAIAFSTIFAVDNPDPIRVELNKKPGTISDDVKRIVVKPRPNYKDKVDKKNLTYHDDPAIEWNNKEADPYWNEKGAMELTLEKELEILEATQNIHYMCLEVVDKVVKDPVLLRLFHIPSDLWPAMRKSWAYLVETNYYRDREPGKPLFDKQFDFLGRFDWSWDGKTPPRMLEYNADTPSLLLESGTVQ